MLGEDLSLFMLRNTLRGPVIPLTTEERTMTDPVPPRNRQETVRLLQRVSRTGLGEVGLGRPGGGEAVQAGELETVLEGGGVRGTVQQGGHVGGEPLRLPDPAQTGRRVGVEEFVPPS